MAPTRLALALAGGGAGHAGQDASEGFVVVETNYRVSPWDLAFRRVAEGMLKQDADEGSVVVSTSQRVRCLPASM